jgi:hypothetical protein
MPKADADHLEAIRIRREALYQALVGLEDALSTPIGDDERWRLRVAMAVDHAANRIEEHIEQTEAPDGLLAEVSTDAPRLARRVAALREDHHDLEKDIHALQVALSNVDDLSNRGAIREQAMDFLGRLARHRQHGADLIYEAYQVDIGASH